MTEKQRIQIYADAETKRRIELAAADHDMSIAEYCLYAIRQQLAEDGPEAMHPTPALNAELIDRIEALQKSIKQRRGGALIDIDQVIEDMRAERDDELFSLH